MKPSIRKTPDGIELYDGDNLNFRAWPMTKREAVDTAIAILKVVLVPPYPEINVEPESPIPEPK